MACLHGYKVQSSVNASIRKFAFELIPPDLSFRYFYFYTDTEVDKRRYSQTLRYYDLNTYEFRLVVLYFYVHEWLFTIFFSDG